MHRRRPRRRSKFDKGGSPSRRGALNYFQVGGRRHTADEEESLFPRLQGAGGLAELERLEHDHVEAGQLHSDVETIYRTWIADASLTELQLRRLKTSTAQLSRLYNDHIAIEDNMVFPKAAQMLDLTAIEEIGKEFRARRQ